MAKVRSLLAKVQSKFDELTSKINRLLSHVPSYLHWVIAKVDKLWSELCAKMTELFDWFRKTLPAPGNPILLHQIGQAWNTALGLPAHKRSNEVDSDALLVDDTWTGTSAEAYKSHIDDQRGALNSVGTVAGAIASAMNTMKTGIWSFWIGVGVALIAFVGGLISVATATGTIVGIPVALALGIATAAAFWGAIGAGCALLHFACSDSRDSINTTIAYSDPWPKFAVTV